MLISLKFIFCLLLLLLLLLLIFLLCFIIIILVYFVVSRSVNLICKFVYDQNFLLNLFLKSFFSSFRFVSFFFFFLLRIVYKLILKNDLNYMYEVWYGIVIGLSQVSKRNLYLKHVRKLIFIQWSAKHALDFDHSSQ